MDTRMTRDGATVLSTYQDRSSFEQPTPRSMVFIVCTRISDCFVLPKTAFSIAV